ncbi:aspartyl-phosphate phosphatase Spo0E family protein [Salipaludibacillus daqingensis]|uniref:aspartyl-phosphate phosphatase Spo0E family protein n=1 Tax=Salipaludibacillus daqingensis TaxID=3041001 RepID=UPI002473FB8C|nr:aspartyl-phosphate phosphatase Spo0E family protein [Salipaludibacillus daqingensis]
MTYATCIELKRKELEEVVYKYGLSSDLALKKSEELDELIIEYQDSQYQVLNMNKK